MTTSKYVTAQEVYKQIFVMFAETIRGITPQNERLQAIAKFCDWVSKYSPKNDDDHMLFDGRWRCYDDLAAMVEYLQNPREFNERMSSFDAFLKRVGVDAPKTTLEKVSVKQRLIDTIEKTPEQKAAEYEKEMAWIRKPRYERIRKQKPLAE